MSKRCCCDVPSCTAPSETTITTARDPRAIDLCAAHAAEAWRFPGRLDLWLAARAARDDTPVDADDAAVRYYVRSHEEDGRQPPPVGTAERALWAFFLGAAQRRALRQTLLRVLVAVTAAAMMVLGLAVAPRPIQHGAPRPTPSWLSRQIIGGLYVAPLPLGVRCHLLLWWLRCQLDHIEPTSLSTYSPRYRAYVSQAVAVVVGMPLAGGKGKADIITRAYTIQRLTLGYAYVAGCWPLASAEIGRSEPPPPVVADLAPQHAYSDVIMAIYTRHDDAAHPEKPKLSTHQTDALHRRERQGYAAVMGASPDENVRLPLTQREDAATCPLNTLAIEDLALVFTR